MADINIPGSIMNAGFYKDSIPVMVIRISKEYLDKIPHTIGERKNFTFIVGDKRYKAGIRTTEKMNYLKFCPDLVGESGENIRLADLFLHRGFNTKDSVTLRVSGDTIELVI